MGVLKSVFKFVQCFVILTGWVEKLWQKIEPLRSFIADLFS